MQKMPLIIYFFTLDVCLNEEVFLKIGMIPDVF